MMIRLALSMVLMIVAKFAFALPVSINATVEGADRPTVLGKTNLPDGMELMVTFIRKDNSYIAQSKVLISGGQFRAGPFSKKGLGLDPGTYQLEVTSPLASFQPESVRAVIGQDGEKLSGPLVQKSVLGHGKVLVYKTAARIGTALAAVDGDRANNQARLAVIAQITAIIRQGRSMEHLRRDDLASAAECGKQMRIWQPKAKALDQSLDFGNLKAAANQAGLCVSCLSSAMTYCERANEMLKSK